MNIIRVKKRWMCSFSVHPVHNLNVSMHAGHHGRSLSGARGAKPPPMRPGGNKNLVQC